MLLSGPNPDLVRAAAWVFLFGLLVCSRVVPLRWAFFLALLKVLIPFLYFVHDPFGSLHLDDDLGYYYGAVGLRQRGLDAVLLATHPIFLKMFLAAMGSIHMAYPLWNLAAITAFGPHYFAPVFLNVGLTFVGAWLFWRILATMEFSASYRSLAFAFFLLHWDVVAWSSFLNLKDTLAMTLTLAAIERLIAVMRRPRPLNLLATFVLLGALVFVRFYAPFLILSAAALHLLLTGGARTRWASAVVITAGLAAFAGWKWELLARVLAQVDPAGAAYGAFRFFLTPLPWNLAPGYGFLLAPAMLHLLCLPLALAAAYLLWNRPGARFLIVYLAVTMLFYALVPELQGSRQRLQAGFVLIWLQYHGLWTLARRASTTAASLSRDPARGAISS
jgi:hypothetical protein